MLKRILSISAVVVALGIAGVATRFYLFLPNAAPAEDLTAPTDAASIERGRYLANHVVGCVVCHSPVDESLPGEPLTSDKVGAGREFPADPYGAGVVRAPNLTRHNIADWSDGELVRAMREGIGKDGRPLFPMMPYSVYREVLTKADALAIVAYLRSLPEQTSDPGRAEIAFPVSMFVRAVPAPMDVEPTAPAADDVKARGQRLLAMALCLDCHNAVDARRQPIEGLAFAGGTKFALPNGTMIQSPNITSDPATGIGAYSDEDLHRAIFEGKGKDGRDLYVMPWTFYAGMSQEDRAALVAAVRAIPAVRHLVAREVPSTAP